jgi:hypothetical protein
MTGVIWRARARARNACLLASYVFERLAYKVLPEDD